MSHLEVAHPCEFAEWAGKTNYGKDADYVRLENAAGVFPLSHSSG